MAIFSPRPRGDREHLKFGQDNTAADTTPVYVQVGGKVQTTTYAANDFAVLNFDTDGQLKTTAAVTIGSITGSVRIGDGANNFATITGGKLDVNATVTSAALSSVVDSVRIGDGSGNFAQITADGRLRISGTVQITDALPTGSNAIGKLSSNSGVDIGDVDVLSIPTANQNADNTLKVAGTVKLVANTGVDIGDVDVLTLPAITIAASQTLATVSNVAAGSIAISDGGNSITVDGTFWQTTQPVSATQLDTRYLSDVSDSVRVRGDVAHDTADSGNPIKVGGKSYNQDGTLPGTATAEGDRANFITDLYGRQYVSIDHPNYFSLNAAYTAAQTETQLKAAPGAGLSLYLTDVVLSVGSTAGTIRLKDGNAGGVNVDIVPPINFAANGGAVMNFRTPLKLVANSSLAITSVVTQNHSVIISGYVAA